MDKSLRTYFSNQHRFLLSVSPTPQSCRVHWQVARWFKCGAPLSEFREFIFRGCRRCVAPGHRCSPSYVIMVSKLYCSTHKSFIKLGIVWYIGQDNRLMFGNEVDELFSIFLCTYRNLCITARNFI